MIFHVTCAKNCEGFGRGCIELTDSVSRDLVEGRIWFELKTTITGCCGEENGEGCCVGNGDTGGISGCGGFASLEVELEDRGEVHTYARFVGEGHRIFAVGMACTSNMSRSFTGELEAIVGQYGDCFLQRAVECEGGVELVRLA